MPYHIAVNQDNLAEGADVVIVGLGTFANGSEYDITDEQEQAFRDANQTDTGGVIDDPEHESFGSYVPNYQPGPSLADAAIVGVTVTEVQEPSPPASDSGPDTSAGPVASSSLGAPADKGGDS